MHALPRRLRGLPRVGSTVVTAVTWRSRLLGLAWLAPDALPDGVGLWLPRTRSVHTFGMRFPLDLVWMDRAGRVVRVDLAVPPGRVRSCRRARGVAEYRARAARPARDDERPARAGRSPVS